MVLSIGTIHSLFLIYLKVKYIKHFPFLVVKYLNAHISLDVTLLVCIFFIESLNPNIVEYGEFLGLVNVIGYNAEEL